MSSWDSGSTRAWRRVRANVLARDAMQGWGCRAHEERWCAAPGVAPHTCTGVATIGHHTKGRAVTGDDPRHVVASCESCNLAIGEPGAKAGDPPATPVTRWK